MISDLLDSSANLVILSRLQYAVPHLLIPLTARQHIAALLRMAQCRNAATQQRSNPSTGRMDNVRFMAVTVHT